MAFRELSEVESEILNQAKEDVDRGLPPTIVGAVILREWLTALAARSNELELQACSQKLEDEDYAELAALKMELAKYGGIGNG